MIRKNSSRKTGKAVVKMAFVHPREKSLSCPDKMSYIQVCKILDNAGIELFQETDRKSLSVAEITGKIENDPDYY